MTIADKFRDWGETNENTAASPVYSTTARAMYLSRAAAFYHAAGAIHGVGTIDGAALFAIAGDAMAAATEARAEAESELRFLQNQLELARAELADEKRAVERLRAALRQKPGATLPPIDNSLIDALAARVAARMAEMD